MLSRTLASFMIEGYANDLEWCSQQK